MFFNESNFGEGLRRSAPKVDTEFYDLLKVPKTASKSDIRRSYRNLAKKLHPDKGGDEEEFKKIQIAFEVLSDPEKRAKYDQFGKEGLRDQAESAGFGSIFDLFSGRRRANRVRKGKNTVFDLPITLEEAFNQATKKLRVTRDVLCKSCKGVGTKSGRSPKCTECDGEGVQLRVQQIGPGMVQQVQCACRACQGTGERALEGDQCRSCKGKKVVEEEKILKVLVEKGVDSGHKITFAGEANQKPGYLPGDVVVNLQLKPHKTFKREGMNLSMNKNVSLSEALGGVEFVVPHLDQRRCLVSTKGTIVQTNQELCVDNEGMPLHTRPFIRGALFIRFIVNMPLTGSLSDSKIEEIKRIMNQPSVPVENHHETHKIELLSKTRKEVQKAQEVYRNLGHEEEKEDEEGHENVASCQAQ